MFTGRPFTSSASARYSALAACALLLSLACSDNDSVTAPTVVDEIPALQSALAATGFITGVTDATGAKVVFTKPRGDEDLDRDFLLRRETSASPWHLDSLTVGFQFNDDKLGCTTCHTELVSVRITAPGLDTLLVQPFYLIPFPGLPQVPLGVPLHVEAQSKLDGDLMFVDNGGEWIRLGSTGPHSFAGDVFPHAGPTALAVQAITDSSLVTVGEHYSAYAYILEYVGGAAAPRLHANGPSPAGPTGHGPQPSTPRMALTR